MLQRNECYNYEYLMWVLIILLKVRLQSSNWIICIQCTNQFMPTNIPLEDLLKVRSSTHPFFQRRKTGEKQFDVCSNFIIIWKNVITDWQLQPDTSSSYAALEELLEGVQGEGARSTVRVFHSATHTAFINVTTMKRTRRQWSGQEDLVETHLYRALFPSSALLSSLDLTR